MSRRIPRKEADLLVVAEAIVGGLKENPDIFKNSPINSKELSAAVSKLISSKDEVNKQKANYEAAIAHKDHDATDLYEKTTEVANFCYRVTKNNQTLLSKVGLSAPQERKPAEMPGQCRLFTVTKQEIDSATFKWQRPVKEGRIRAYIIQRRKFGDKTETWETVWTTVDKEAEIKGQPLDQIFEYRVRALNKAGLGVGSNAVSIRF
ncbi:MAG: fibronectin type III domain-containing protein [Deltaproteobacteria bacterium]|nr:fibronectin type III domain-containing protein [Deltaproteobacteria bacterium]